MRKIKITLFPLLFTALILINLHSAYAWHDETHLATAKAAGYLKWYNAAGADIAKLKAGRTEMNNHFFDNPKGISITPGMVLKQAERYNKREDREGHLYGAIIASIRNYLTTFHKGKYAEYHLAYCAHYVGDLSQPLHNMPYDDFNKIHHSGFDGTVEDEVLRNIKHIRRYMYPIKLGAQTFEKDLAGEIARIANVSRQLGKKLRRENRLLTREEAYRQLGHSASLLKAILGYLEKVKHPHQ